MWSKTAALFTWALVAAPGFSAQPNILFLFSDDQRADTIRTLGNSSIQTPNLDKLVQQGFAFTNAYCMGAMVGAVCVPSRAMLMTGRSLFRATSTRTSAKIPPEYVMWPEIFRKAGYRTFGIGKWHNDRPSFNRAFDGGGPIFFGGMTDQFKVPVQGYNGEGKYPKENQRIVERFSTELFGDAAVEILNRARKEPFVLYVAFTVPHDPRTPPEPYARKYSPDAMALPKNFLPKHPFDNGEMEVRDEKLLPVPRTREDLRKEIAAYYAMIEHMDAQIGRILTALETAGHAQNTIVVFASDHGLALGSHGLLGKQNLYEHSMRAPLIFSGPGIPRDRQSGAFCYLFDVYPTLCELAGKPVPRTVEGRSLLPIMRGQSKTHREAVFGAYRDVQRMVRDERWKLITYPKANRHQLFDLASDPDEISNLANRPEHQGRILEMVARMRQFQLHFGDPLVQSDTFLGLLHGVH